VISKFMRLCPRSVIVIISIRQFPVLSTIPLGATSIRTILSFIRIIRAGAHFYGNFFAHFFCLELFHVNFFRARSGRLQHAVRYVTPHVPILSFLFCLFPTALPHSFRGTHGKKRIRPRIRAAFKYELRLEQKEKERKGLSYRCERMTLYDCVHARSKEHRFASISCSIPVFSLTREITSLGVRRP